MKSVLKSSVSVAVLMAAVRYPRPTPTPVQDAQVCLNALFMNPLPEGVYEMGGEYTAECVSCSEYTPIHCDLAEFDAEHHYCGRSPRCCP